MQDQATAQATANRLAREARDHKRASGQHKRKAREKRQQLDEFIAACAASGITVTVNQHAVQGGHGAPSSQHAPRNTRI